MQNRDQVLLVCGMIVFALLLGMMYIAGQMNVKADCERIQRPHQCIHKPHFSHSFTRQIRSSAHDTQHRQASQQK